MKLLLALIISLLPFYGTAQPTRQFGRNPNSPTSAILQQQFQKGDKRLGSDIKERLVGASFYRDSIVGDSFDYYYSHNRGSTVDMDFAWYYNETFLNYPPIVYQAPPVLLFYDSMHHYSYYRDTGNNVSIESTARYRHYDRLGRLLRDSFLLSNDCHVFADLTYATSDNIVHYSYTYPTGCFSTPESLVVHRAQTFNAHNQRTVDSIYYSLPIRLIKTIYDSSNRVGQITFSDADNTNATLEDNVRYNYTYDSLGRLILAVREYPAQPGVWTYSGRDSFAYLGSDRMYYYTANFNSSATSISEDSLAGYLAIYTMTADRRWGKLKYFNLGHWNNYYPSVEYEYEYTQQGNLKSTREINNYIYPTDFKTSLILRYETYQDTVDTVTPPTITKPPFIYPNPVSDILHATIDNPDGQSIFIKIIDPIGTVVRKLSYSVATQMDIPVSDLASGAYMLQVFMNGNPARTTSFVKL